MFSNAFIDLSSLVITIIEWCSGTPFSEVLLLVACFPHLVKLALLHKCVKVSFGAT